jgi:hypothetical protein
MRVATDKIHRVTLSGTRQLIIPKTIPPKSEVVRTHISTNKGPHMSHFTTIKTQIKDIEALRAACQELGLSLLEKTDARGYYENKIKGDYVIRLKGPYDIALNKEKDGAYGVTADLWAGNVEKEVGTNYGRLLQLYGVHKAIREARRKGLFVKRSQYNDGAIKLVIAGV